jgi:hypothetical protein
MSQRKPSEKLRSQIKERAKNICEYCKSQAAYSSQPFAIEHIKPFIEGGKPCLRILLSLVRAVTDTNTCTQPGAIRSHEKKFSFSIQESKNGSSISLGTEISQ